MRRYLRSRNLWTVVGISLLAAAVYLYVLPRRPRQPPAPSRRLMPDTPSRPISLVVCSVNSARRSALRNARLATNIVNALPPRIGVILAVNDRQAFTVARNPWPSRVRFLELTPDTSITIWPQDPFVVMHDDAGASSLLISHEFSRVKDREMAIQLAGFLGWPWRDSSLTFEGGNIVSDERHVFIGANTIRRNAIALGQPEAWVARQFEAELGKPVLVIGPPPQPIGHIDMMLTVLGQGKILLADPGWGARLAETQLAEAPGAVEAFERNCQRMFLGAPGIRALHYSTGKVVTAPAVAGETRTAIDHCRTIAPQLDRLAKELTSRGYKVFRIPYLSVRFAPVGRTGGAGGAESSPTSQAENPAAKRRGTPRYPELTYNNVLLETAASRRIVYLPQYGWDTFDRKARQVWQKLVDEVTPVPGFAICAMYGGSLRCCTKILERTGAASRK